MKQGSSNADYIFSGRNVPLSLSNYPSQLRKNGYSFHVNQPQSPNNAFANLRNEISNLRQQFSKLIQKDAFNNRSFLPKEKKQKESKQHLVQRRQHRNSSMYHQSQVREGFKTISENNPHIDFKLNQFHNHSQKRPDENVSLEKKLLNLNEQLSNPKISLNQKINQNGMVHITSQSSNKIKQLQNQKHSLLQINEKLKENVQSLKNQLNKREEISKRKQQEWNEKLISLQVNLNNLENNLSVKNDLFNHKEFLLKEKNQEILLLNQKFKQQIEILKQKNDQSQETNIQLVSKIKLLENTLQQQQKHQRRYSIKIEESEKTNKNEGELLDLRKRVQSYKKSLENLNASLNSTRQKLALAREQLKQTQNECKKTKKINEELFQDNAIKQTLISSLYKDIGILDKQMKQIPHLKSLISAKSESIDSLNEIIMELKCSNLSLKFSLNSQYKT